MSDLVRYTKADGPPIATQCDAFTKLPTPVYMRKVEQEFEVETAEGIMHGNPGDWLCYDPRSGHVWPVSNDYKEMHYV